MAQAGGAAERYLRQTLAPGSYAANPNRLVPSVAYLWVVDSPLAFAKALQLLAVDQGTAMDSVLLLADVLSNGTGQTLTFRTSAAGIVAAQAVALSRVPTGEGPYCNGLAIGGERYAFPLNAVGGVTRPRNPGVRF